MPNYNRISIPKKRKKQLLAAVDGNPVCHICKTPIDMTLPMNHTCGWSIDHRVPRSKGGTNELSNLLPAHRYCNERRGNKMTGKRRKWKQ